MKTNRTRSTPRKEPTERAPGIDAGPNARGGDATGLMPVVAALAKLNDGQLCALIDATNDVPQIVPGLLAWIGHACDWELNRRACIDFPLQSPDAAIPPEEGSASIAAALATVARGASIVRVHDVRATVDALKVWHAIESGTPP